MTARIAMSMRVVATHGYDEPRDALSQDWIRTIVDWGGTPLPVPNMADSVNGWLADMCPNAIILTGGNDLAPPLHAPPDSAPSRDQTETQLIEFARTRRIPVFGTCRGLHMINLFFGGRVSAIPSIGSHVACRHGVSLQGALQRLAGVAEVEVNSFHNLGVSAQDLAPELIALAHSTSDGFVEAIAHRQEPILAVQWHPERPGGPSALDKALFDHVLAGASLWTDA